MGIEVIAIAALATAAVGTAVGMESSRKQASIEKSTAKNQAEAQIEYEKEMADANAKALAEEAKTKGKRISASAEKLKKRQRAQSAAAGLTLGEGTAEDITTETDILSQRDIDITKSDAARRGELGIKKAAGRAPLLTQKAKDIGRSAEAQAAGQQTGALFDFAGKAIGTAGAFGGTGAADNDIVGKVGAGGYSLEGDYSLKNDASLFDIGGF